MPAKSGELTETEVLDRRLVDEARSMDALRLHDHADYVGKIVLACAQTWSLARTQHAPADPDTTARLRRAELNLSDAVREYLGRGGR